MLRPAEPSLPPHPVPLALAVLAACGADLDPGHGSTGSTVTNTATSTSPTTGTGTGTSVTTATTGTTTTPTTASTSTSTTSTPAPVHVFGPEQRLVVSDQAGVALYDANGHRTHLWAWADLTPSCDRGCDGEGVAADADGLLATYARFRGPEIPGGVVRLGPGGKDLQVDWVLEEFQFPHDVARDPGGQGIIVVNSLEHELVWVEEGGTADDRLHVVGEDHPDFDRFYLPNGFELIDWGGRAYALVNNRGSSASDYDEGQIALWDITDPANASLVWQYPEGGFLGAPHGARFRWFDGSWWLIYAHSTALGRSGTAGFAVTHDPTVRPSYVADLQPGASLEEWTFPRGVELTTDGQVYLTEPFNAGDLGDDVGFVARFAMPTSLAPTGKTGAFTGDGAQLELVVLEEVEKLVGGLDVPFEAWIWTPTF